MTDGERVFSGLVEKWSREESRSRSVAVLERIYGVSVHPPEDTICSFCKQPVTLAWAYRLGRWLTLEPGAGNWIWTAERWVSDCPVRGEGQMREHRCEESAT